MKTRRQKKWQARLIVREYTDLLNKLTALDPDFRFERACCGEVSVRERYSQGQLRERVQDVYLRMLKQLSPYLNTPLSAAGRQAVGLAAQASILNTRPGRVHVFDGNITPTYDPTHLYK